MPDILFRSSRLDGCFFFVGCVGVGLCGVWRGIRSSRHRETSPGEVVCACPSWVSPTHQPPIEMRRSGPFSFVEAQSSQHQAGRWVSEGKRSSSQLGRSGVVGCVVVVNRP